MLPIIIFSIVAFIVLALLMTYNMRVISRGRENQKAKEEERDAVAGDDNPDQDYRRALRQFQTIPEPPSEVKIENNNPDEQYRQALRSIKSPGKKG